MYNHKTSYSFILLAYLLGISPCNLLSQENKNIPDPDFIYREVQDDNYIYIPKSSRLTSPAYNFITSRISTFQVNVNESGLNILGDAANEPSIAIDQNNTGKIVIGWRQFDTIKSNFRQAGNGYSLDGGVTWKVIDPIEAGVFRSDPVLDSDFYGNIFYNSLKSNFECHVFKSTEKNIWDLGTYAHGGDKQWMVIDKIKRNGVNKNTIYAYWKYNLSPCSPGAFTRSINNGLSYEDCITIPNYLIRGTMAVGLNGELFLCGETNGFSILKSSNAGNINQSVVWDLSKTVNLDGRANYYTGPNPTGLLGQSWIATDVSNTSTKGNVYLLSTVSRYSKIDDADVMFARSTNGGISWSKPIQINHDSLDNNWNWFGTMSVAPNGRIDVVWLDTRHDQGGVNSKLYYSKSVDGGIKWSDNEALSNSFDPHVGWPNQMKMGDYFHMISDNNGAHLAWCATFNEEQDIYYSFILADSPTDVNNIEDSDLVIASIFQNIPNPFSEFTSIGYSIKNTTKVKLEIWDATLSKSIKVLASENKIPGDYTAIWDGNNNSGNVVPNGIYFYKLTIGAGKFLYKKMLLMR